MRERKIKMLQALNLFVRSSQEIPPHKKKIKIYKEYKGGTIGAETKYTVKTKTRIINNNLLKNGKIKYITYVNKKLLNI